MLYIFASKNRYFDTGVNLMFFRLSILLACIGTFTFPLTAQPKAFVSVHGHQLYSRGKPYYFVGANYWYGSLLPLEKDRKRGIERLRKELDLLKTNGVTNLRLLGGAEGVGPINGVTRVGPALQAEQGKFDEHVLAGLDRVLAEMGKRNMRAVIFLSNNWEWSGGFQQYLIWNHVISDEWLIRKPSWDELRDNVARFYSCEPCKEAYDKQARLIVTRKNSVTRKKYVDDPTIMAWELANEPRPMRRAANDDYMRWIFDTAGFVRSLDRNHLITIGHEGRIGTEDISLYRTINATRDLDYLTIHIWPKNWEWFSDHRMAEGFQNIVEQTEKYIAENLAVAKALNRPLVIEEFGLPRDGQSFDPGSSTNYRDRYYRKVFSNIGGRSGGDQYIAGAAFWAYGGIARPKKGQTYWKAGDDRTGDPPMEEQGLNSVFDTDISTWGVIRNAAAARSRGTH